jgi:hypothetical protein
MIFVAIEPAETPVGQVNQWASHLTGSLIGPVFETMVQAEKKYCCKNKVLSWNRRNYLSIHTLWILG